MLGGVEPRASSCPSRAIAAILEINLLFLRYYLIPPPSGPPPGWAGLGARCRHVLPRWRRGGPPSNRHRRIRPALAEKTPARRQIDTPDQSGGSKWMISRLLGVLRRALLVHSAQ